MAEEYEFDATPQVEALLKEWHRRFFSNVDFEEWQKRWAAEGGQVLVPANCPPYSIQEQAIMTVPRFLQEAVFAAMDELEILRSVAGD